MIDNTTVIYMLYPNVTHTRGTVAYDINGNEVDYDLQAVETKVAELQGQ